MVTTAGKLRGSEWDGVSYGQGRGKAHACVQVACPRCGQPAGALCLGGKNGKTLTFSCHVARGVDYRAVLRSGEAPRRPARVRRSLRMCLDPSEVDLLRFLLLAAMRGAVLLPGIDLQCARNLCDRLPDLKVSLEAPDAQ